MVSYQEYSFIINEIALLSMDKGLQKSLRKKSYLWEKMRRISADAQSLTSSLMGVHRRLFIVFLSR